MDARSRKLCACLGYSIRLAGKSDLDEVSQMLWQALHLVTAKVDGRRPISLFSALDEKGSQVQIPKDHDADFKEHIRSGKDVGSKSGLHTQADDVRTAAHATQTEVEVISRPQFETIVGTTMEKGLGTSRYRELLTAAPCHCGKRAGPTRFYLVFFCDARSS